MMASPMSQFPTEILTLRDIITHPQMLLKLMVVANYIHTSIILEIPTVYNSPRLYYVNFGCDVNGEGGIDTAVLQVNGSYGNYSYNVSFRNTYSTNPSKSSITAKLITGSFALRTPAGPTTRVTCTRMATSAATAGLVRVSLVIPTAGFNFLFYKRLMQKSSLKLSGHQ